MLASAECSPTPDLVSEFYDLHLESDYDSDSEEVKTYQTEDGITVYPRDDIPRKEFNFDDVPAYNDSSPAVYGCNGSMSIAPWCDLNTLLKPPEWLKELKYDAQFILLTDSEETFSPLCFNHCDTRHKFFLLKGAVDASCCYFLWLLKREWRIPIVALVDYDPMSLKLLNFFETWKPKEEVPLGFSGVELDIKWLGLRRVHVDVAEDPLNAEVLKSRDFVEMDDEDLAVAESLLKDNFVNKSPERVAEVKRMIEHKLMTIAIALYGDFVMLSYVPAILDDLLNKKRWI